MTDSGDPHTSDTGPSGDETPLDRDAPLSLASAGLDYQLTPDELTAANHPDVLAERLEIEGVTEIIRQAPLPSPPPGLAAAQIAEAMTHFVPSPSLASPSLADAPKEGVPATPIPTPSGSEGADDLARRRAAKERTQAERAQKRAGRQMKFLTRAAGLIVVVGLLGVAANSLGGGGGSDDAGSFETAEAGPATTTASAQFDAADGDAGESMLQTTPAAPSAAAEEAGDAGGAGSDDALAADDAGAVPELDETQTNDRVLRLAPFTPPLFGWTEASIMDIDDTPASDLVDELGDLAGDPAQSQ